MANRMQGPTLRPDPATSDDEWIRESVRISTLETRDCLAVFRSLEAHGVRIIVTLRGDRQRLQSLQLEYGSATARPSGRFGLAPRDLHYDPALHGDEAWLRTRAGRAAAVGRPRKVYRRAGGSDGTQRPGDRQHVLRSVLRGLSEARDLVQFIERVEEQGVKVTCNCRPYSDDIQGFLFEKETAQVRGSDALVTRRILGELGLAYDPARHGEELLKRSGKPKGCRNQTAYART